MKTIDLITECLRCTDTVTCARCAVKEHGGMLYTFDDPTGKWVFVCACGTALSHVLCSKVEAFMDEHYGQPATAPVTVGMMTVEV